MALLTEPLLASKLSSWTLRSNATATLGFKDSDDAQIRQELEALVYIGILEKDGERRGLKYRYKNKESNKSSFTLTDKEDNENTIEDEVIIDTATVTSLHAFYANRESVKAETNQHTKQPLQLLSSLVTLPIKDPSVLSHTVSYKRTSDGNIIVTFWVGCVKQYEKEYTIPAFTKLISAELKQSVDFTKD